MEEYWFLVMMMESMMTDEDEDGREASVRLRS